MWGKLRKNRSIAVRALETFVFGVYMTYVANIFIKHPEHIPKMKMHHSIILQHAQDPYLSTLAIALGAVAFFIAVTDITEFHAKRFAMSLMLGFWTAYFVLFLYRDISSGHPLGFETVLVGFICLQILTDLGWGNPS